MDELKPCPFCGKEGNTDGGLAWCSDIECFLSNINMPLSEWNTRPIEDALRESAESAKILKTLEGQAREEIEQLKGQLAQQRYELQPNQPEEVLHDR